LNKFLLVVAGIIAFIIIAASVLLMMARPLPSVLVLDRTCQAPCWLGITPGVSTSWGVTQRLLESDFVDAPTIDKHEWGPLEGLITWRFKRPAGDLAGFAYFDGETLSYLRILTLGAMSLSESLEKYGDPAAFWLEQRDRPTEAWAQVNMIYPGLGCILEVRFDYTGQVIPASVILTEDAPIRAVIYFNPGDPPVEFSVPEEQLQQWAGLGAVSLPASVQ
jgi:hypothetical protein